MIWSVIVASVGILICFAILTILGMYLRSEAKHYYFRQAPTVGTYPRHYQLMKKSLKLQDHTSLIDLGCGDGSVLRFFSKQYNLSLLKGVDNNRTAIWFGKLRNMMGHYDAIDLQIGDIMEQDISQYDYIYVFLFPHHLDTLQEWLQKNMKPDAIVISNTFEFSHWNVSKELRDPITGSVIRLYKKIK